MMVSKIKFQGANAIELKTEQMRLVAVCDYGPRIAFFGRPDGENLFLWAPGKYTRGEWDLRGGHRVWVTRPGADECEDTYATDNERCEVSLFGNGFAMTGERNAANATRRGINVKLLGANSVQVDSYLINDGEMLYSGGLWALTCTLPTPGTRYAIPIGDGSSWDAFSMVHFRQWGGHGKGGFNDPQIKVSEDLLLIEPAGVENKRMVQAHHGIMAMSDPVNKVTFAKRVAYERGMNYPLNCNLAFYIGPNNFMVEMESMGPEHTLRPKQDLIHRETWTLVPEALTFKSGEEVCRLFR